MKINSTKFYDNYFSGQDFATYRYDVGSFCTRKAIISQISHKSGNLLEIGTGISSLLIDLQNFNCHGIDISGKTINFVQNLFRQIDKKAILKVGDATKLPFESNFFDTIISSHTLEHIKDDFSVIKECARVLKNKGELIIFVPGRINGLASKKEFLKYGHHRYYNLKRFKELEAFVYPELKITNIFYPHKIHNLIWNKLKNLFRCTNYPIKKWILRDNKSYEFRPTYQKIFLPTISTTLDALDKLTMHSEKKFFGTEFNVLVKFEKS
ncbi:class I SAM-dependent methyltransferase [Candidatus Babeliales bacterium]|nr:class I SAM-dependent methyltransferase [Candidatus Babeliales bacterium]MCF7899675.1 class I SAM-dependent methyltransferase [Candidatus Babeliales bacterium]